MSKTPFWMLLTMLGACGAPCDNGFCDGVFETGQVAFAANPGAVDGLYVPDLANCRLTVRAGRDILEYREWDELGRQVLDVRGGPEDFVTTSRVWDGPCQVERHDTFGLCDTIEESTCDGHGFPEATTRHQFINGDLSSTTGILHERTYTDDGELRFTRTSWVGEISGIALHGVDEVRWKDGLPVRELNYNGEPDDPRTRVHGTDRTWTDGMLTRAVSFDGSDTTHEDRWHYEGDRLVATGSGDGRLDRYVYDKGARWPHALRLRGETLDLDYTCP